MIELKIGRLATVLIALLVALLLWQAKPTRSRKSVGYVRGESWGEGSRWVDATPDSRAYHESVEE